MKKSLKDHQQSETVKSEVDEHKARQIREILDNEVFQDLILEYKADLLLRTLHVRDENELILLHNSVKSADEVVSYIQAALDKYEY